MNKKILISLSVIGVVAAIAIGGTVAYFSDTETSTGNTFTAGTLDLVIDVDGNLTWEDPIFSYDHMKPGDNDEKTLSLHVTNDACGFIDLTLDTDQENSCIEPEYTDESECVVEPNTNNGELNDEVNWVIWRDEGGILGWNCSNFEPECSDDLLEGDNIYQPGPYEEVLTYGPLDENKEWGFGKIVASDVHYYGFAWCFGDIDPITLTCSGQTVNNQSQSDSFTATMTVTAEQFKNQYNDTDNQCPTGEIQ